MECPSCKADIPEGNRFCEACGAPAPLFVLRCGGPLWRQVLREMRCGADGRRVPKRCTPDAGVSVVRGG